MEYCSKCHDETKHATNDGSPLADLCEKCQRDYRRGYHAVSLIGRAANGYQRDGGTRYHAVNYMSGESFCGAKPGKRSAGWSSYYGDDVTCPRCLDKIAKIERRVKVAVEMSELSERVKERRTERDFDATMTRATQADVDRMWKRLWGNATAADVRFLHDISDEPFDLTQEA